MDSNNLIIHGFKTKKIIPNKKKVNFQKLFFFFLNLRLKSSKKILDSRFSLFYLKMLEKLRKFFRKVCVHCKCDRSEHEIGPNQVLSVYERLGIKPSRKLPFKTFKKKFFFLAEMAAVMKNQRGDVPGSVSHGYAWVPPGLTRTKVCVFCYLSHIWSNLIISNF